MNPYKLKRIVEFVCNKGVLLDVAGREVALDEVLESFGLDELLRDGEMAVVKQELTAVMEADAFMMEVKLRMAQRTIS